MPVNTADSEIETIHDPAPERLLLQQYGVFGLARLGWEILLTKIVTPRARLMRRPYTVLGARHIDFGKQLTTGRRLRMEAMPRKNHPTGVVIRLGHGVKINDDVHIGAVNSITIGDGVLIGSKVLIVDHNHGVYSGAQPHSSPLIAPDERPIVSKPVVIGKNVWIGEMVAILPGAEIGEGCVIGAMSMVSGVIPPYTIAVGSPARVVKRFNVESGSWEKV